jgi:thiamine biosynthesis protein ThiS
VDYVPDETVQGLLRRLKFTFPLVIVKIDGNHIPRKDFQTVTIPDDAEISVIHMISGG